MAVTPIRFSPERAIELVLYIAKRLRYPTFHSISKILYFADREHLSRFGSLLSGDSYAAMRHGPVPSEVYNLLKAATNRREPHISPHYFQLVGKAFTVQGKYRVLPLRDSDPAMLSDSDRSCLDLVLKQHGRASFETLTRRSHDAAWKSADENDFIDVTAIARTLPNAKDVLAYLGE